MVHCQHVNGPQPSTLTRFSIFVRHCFVHQWTPGLPIGRALLVQLQFVTIHPFMDGNGRLARLLMNRVLLIAGLPWVTIRSGERVPFFLASDPGGAVSSWSLETHDCRGVSGEPQMAHRSDPRGWSGSHAGLLRLLPPGYDHPMSKPAGQYQRC